MGVILREAAMTIAADAPAISRSPVAAAVARGYLRLGCTVVETPLAVASGVAGAEGEAVVAADLGVVECVAGEDLAAAVGGLRRLVAHGWEVNLVVAASQMGEAHRTLRGTPVRLHPWWLGPDDGVCFGAPEVP
jgi:hypothetical protein